MENNLQTYENENLTREESATELDLKIKAYANMAWQNLVESCKCLKRMRDTKKYEKLGYSSFGEYTEASLNIKERQAYTYISTLEKQGEAFLQSNASLGITKLALLNAIPATDRQDFVENHDIAGMSVSEVEALVKENDGRAEQIELLSGELSDKNTELDEAEERISELEAELETERNKPTEVAVAEPDEEMLNKIRSEAAEAAKREAEKIFKAEKKKLKETLNAEKEKAVSAATESAKKELEEYKAKIEAADASLSEAAKKAELLEKKLATGSSPEATKFTFYFDALNEDYQKIFDSISKIKPENPELAEKYAKAMHKFQAVIRERFTALGYPMPEIGKDTAEVIKFPDSEDTGRCSKCGGFCAIDDRYCSSCGAELTEKR